MKLINRTEIDKPETTYNLHIENNHNYIANGIVVSNCHGLKGAQLSKILTDHCARIPYRFAVTGTLPKEPADQMAVNVAVGHVKYTVNASHLIDKGILSRLHINVLQLEEDLVEEYQQFCRDEVGFGEKPPTYIQFKEGYFPDFTSEKDYLHKNGARIEFIAAMIEQKRDERKGNVLCLVDNISFGRKLAKQIEGAIFVNGQDVKQKDRKGIYDLFKEKDDLVVIATVHIAGTGLSINRIFKSMCSNFTTSAAVNTLDLFRATSIFFLIVDTTGV